MRTISLDMTIIKKGKIEKDVYAIVHGIK